MSWLSIEVKIVRKRNFGRMRYVTTNLPVNMASNNCEEFEYFIDRVKDHLVRRKKYKPENITFIV